jgi:hypothetical protein
MTRDDSPPHRENTALSADRLIELGQKGQGLLPVSAAPDNIAGQVGGMPVMQAQPAQPSESQPPGTALLGVATPENQGPETGSTE